MHIASSTSLSVLAPVIQRLHQRIMFIYWRVDLAYPSWTLLKVKKHDMSQEVEEPLLAKIPTAAKVT